MEMFFADVPDITLPSNLSSSSQVTSEYVMKYTSELAVKNAPTYTRWHTPGLLGCMLLSALRVRSQVHTEYAWKHTSEYVLKYTPGHALKNVRSCTQWYTCTLLDSTLPRKLSSTLLRMLSSILPIALDDTLPAYLVLCF